jgi:hypothetical protein
MASNYLIGRAGVVASRSLAFDLDRCLAVDFWLGYAIWWENPGAALGRFFDSLAVVGTWGDQPATKWGGRGRPVGHTAVPPAVPRWPLPLAKPRGPFFPGEWPQR